MSMMSYLISVPCVLVYQLMFSCSISLYQIVRALHYLKEKHNVIHTGMPILQPGQFDGLSLSVQFKCDTCIYACICTSTYVSGFEKRAHFTQNAKNVCAIKNKNSASAQSGPFSQIRSHNISTAAHIGSVLWQKPAFDIYGCTHKLM